MLQLKEKHISVKVPARDEKKVTNPLSNFSHM